MKILTDSDFDSFISSAEKPVLVCFTATWCAPCKKMKPILERLSTEIQDVEFVQVDVDSNLQTAKMYKVQAMPTLMLFKNGKKEKESIGLMLVDKIINFVK